MAADYPDPHNFIESFFDKDSRFCEDSSFKNPTIQDMLERALVEEDPQKWIIQYLDIQNKVAKECIYIWLAQTIDIRVYHKNITKPKYSFFHGEHYFLNLKKQTLRNY